MNDTKPESLEPEYEPQVNQTNFASATPLMQTDAVHEKLLARKSDAEVSAEELSNRKKNRKLVDILVGVGITIVVLGMGSAWFLMQRGVTLLPSPDSSPTATPLETDPSTLRVRALYQEIKNADPAAELLPFPPVDMELTLDPFEKP